MLNIRMKRQINQMLGAMVVLSICSMTLLNNQRAEKKPTQKHITEAPTTVTPITESLLESNFSDYFRETLNKVEELIIRHNTSSLDPTVLSYYGGWLDNSRICNNVTRFIGTKDFPLQHIHTQEGPLYLYTSNAKLDDVARRIKIQKGFESNIDYIIRYFLDKDPQTNLIDIGANIGVRSLQVARIGRSVIAFEALDENIYQLCASVIKNNVTDKLTIVNNAISDDHSMAKISMSAFGDKAGTYIDSPQTRKNKGTQERIRAYKPKKAIPSVMLDDLLLFPNFESKFKKVFVKLDIEGFEHKALIGGAKFFEKVDVTGIIMEWRWHKSYPSAKKIIAFFRKYKFSPFAPDIKNFVMLDSSDYNFWPHDLLWLPDSSEIVKQAVKDEKVFLPP